MNVFVSSANGFVGTVIIETLLSELSEVKATCLAFLSVVSI